MSTQTNSYELAELADLAGVSTFQDRSLISPQSAQSFGSHSDLNHAERAEDMSMPNMLLFGNDGALIDVPLVPGVIPRDVSTMGVDWNDLPEDDSVRQKWSPRRGWHWGAAIFLLIEAGTFGLAARLIHRPFLFQIIKSPLPKHLPIPVYNFIITLTGSIMSAVNLAIWTQLGAGFLVSRFSKKRINYRFYERLVHWARGSIHLQVSLSLLISLALFIIFQSYSAAFTAAFGVNPAFSTFTATTPMINLSANADILLTNVGAPLFDPQGNDFDTNLFKLNVQFSNYTPTMSPFIFVDGIKVQGTGGMVLGAEIGANTVMLSQNSSTGLNPKDSKLLLENYGTNLLHYAAAGVHAATRCAMAGKYMTANGSFYSNLYTIFNISTPSCGQMFRAYNSDLNFTYDAYSCLDSDQLTVMTGIIRTNPSNASLVEAMECSTTLSDALGSGYFKESSASFTLDSGPFESTPMVQKGVFQVLQYTTAGWIENISRQGSQGLLALIQSTPLDDSTMMSKMEDAISYLYALGGAKIINFATQASLRGSESPFKSSNTTVQITSDLFQIGYGPKGAHKYLIAFLAASAVLALVSAVCMFWFPPMPLDPTEPQSMMLLALNSRQSELLNGTSVGRLPPSSQPDRPWRESLNSWLVVLGSWFLDQCCGSRMTRRESKVVPKSVYEDLEFQLESEDNKHLQLIPYGRRGAWQNEWTESRPPNQEQFYR